MRTQLSIFFVSMAFASFSQIILEDAKGLSRSQMLDALDLHSRNERIFHKQSYDSKAIKEPNAKSIYGKRINDDQFTLIENENEQLAVDIAVDDQNQRLLTKYRSGRQINSLKIPGYGGTYFINSLGSIVTTNWYENWGTVYNFYDANLNPVGSYEPFEERGFTETRIGWNEEFVVIYAIDKQGNVKLSKLNHRGGLLSHANLALDKAHKCRKIIVKKNQIILQIKERRRSLIKIFDQSLNELWDYSPTPPLQN